MAKVTLTVEDTEFSMDTNDYGAKLLVEKIGTAFAEAGGAWIGGSRMPRSDGAAGMLMWVPAGSAQVDVEFDDPNVVDSLTEVPGFIS